MIRRFVNDMRRCWAGYSWYHRFWHREWRLREDRWIR